MFCTGEGSIRASHLSPQSYALVANSLLNYVLESPYGIHTEHIYYEFMVMDLRRDKKAF